MTLQQAINDLNSIQLQGSDSAQCTDIMDESSMIADDNVLDNADDNSAVKVLTLVEISACLRKQGKQIAQIKHNHELEITRLENKHLLEMSFMKRNMTQLQKEITTQNNLLTRLTEGGVNVTLNGKLQFNSLPDCKD